MPIGVLPVARPSTACPPARRRSLIISAMRRAMVRAISSYSTMTTGTRSLEDAIAYKIRQEGGGLLDSALPRIMDRQAHWPRESQRWQVGDVVRELSCQLL